jgi:replicative DNA helicase
MIDLNKTPPCDLHAERTILGSILLDNTAYYQAIESGFVAEDFSLDSHQRIFARMSGLMDAGRAVDIVTLSHEMAAHKELEAVRGVAYLAELTEGLPRRPVISEYILIVKDKAMARRVMAISSGAITRAADQSEPSVEIITAAIEAMEDSLARGWKRAGKEIKHILAADQPRFDKEADAPYTGVLGASLFTPEINRITCGIQEGELCLICARPMQGKTEAAIQTIVDNARRGLRVHMQSMEMREHQIVRRMLRYVAQIPVINMRDPRTLTPEQRRKIVWAREELFDLPIFIDDTPELTIREYRSRCVLAAKRWKADLIVTDYAQLLLVPRAKSPVEEAKAQAETLRYIARNYCRSLALAQLRRAPPNDLNRYPDIEDIFGSSAFEQAAQIILLLHRTRENKTYSGEDFAFIGKMRELQTIAPLGICAERWGGFRDRYAGEAAGQQKKTEPPKGEQRTWQNQI